MRILALLSFVLVAAQASADYYSCYKKVYEAGWLRKYDYKGQTWGANTKKSGALSSTIHVSTENITSSVDPGVSTGESASSTQYTSSWGDCAGVDIIISKQFRDDYIEQNLHEIKKQVALGSGYHVESLAVLSGCNGPGGTVWNKALQAHTSEFYDAASGPSFRHILDGIIDGNAKLHAMCTPPTT